MLLLFVQVALILTETQYIGLKHMLWASSRLADIIVTLGLYVR